MKSALLSLPPQARALSLDVFDTAITRSWARPEHVWWACAHRLRQQGLLIVDNTTWLHWRKHAQREAMTRHGDDLASLADIYANLAPMLNWTAAQSQTAQDIECECELASVWPVAPVQTLWSSAQARRLPLKFLSDMYLPAPQVHRLLAHCGYRCDVDDVFVSCERRASKSGATLYGVLTDVLGLRGSDVMHVGDHPTSDVAQAHRAGFMAQHWDAAHLSRDELRVAGSAAPALLSSAVAGALRVARVNSPELAPTQRDVHLFGREHGGPLLTLYVWWLLSEAERLGLKRLYFLSRDGQVLLEIARRLQAEGSAPGISLHYLHGSRQAWFAASIARWDAAQVRAILDEPHDRFSQLPTLAARMGFDSVQHLLDCWPGAAACSHAGDNRAVADTLVAAVAPVQAMAHLQRLRSTALDYFHQQGLFGEETIGIVDLGWRGRLQVTLERLLAQSPRTVPQVHGFYIALLTALPSHRTNTLLSATAGGRVAMPAPAHLFEMLCEADHGTITGYERQGDGQVHARYRATPDPQLVAWGLDTYRDGVVQFAQVFARTAQLLPAALSEREGVAPLFCALAQRWIHLAERSGAAAFARMPTTYSSSHGDLSELAPPLSLLDAWMRALSLGRMRASGRQTPWLAGSLARSAPGADSAYRWLWSLTHANKRRLPTASSGSIRVGTAIQR